MLNALLDTVKKTLFRPQFPPRTSYAWCPRCRRDLNGDDESLVRDDRAVHYRCRTCGCLSWWSFDASCPILLGSSNAPTIVAVGRRKTSDDQTTETHHR